MKTTTILFVLIGFFTQSAFSDQNALLFHDEILLSKAVAEFNRIATKNKTGKNEPVLSADEVVASIRGIIFNEIPPMAPQYKEVFQRL